MGWERNNSLDPCESSASKSLDPNESNGSNRRWWQ